MNNVAISCGGMVGIGNAVYVIYFDSLHLVMVRILILAKLWLCVLQLALQSWSYLFESERELEQMFHSVRVRLTATAGKL